MLDLCESFFYDGNTLVECCSAATKLWDGQLLCDFCCNEAFNEAAWASRWNVHQPMEEMMCDVQIDTSYW